MTTMNDPLPSEHLHSTCRRRFTAIPPTSFVTLHTYVPLSPRVTLCSVRLVFPVPLCSTAPFGAVHVTRGVGLPSTSHTSTASPPSTAVTFSSPEIVPSRTVKNIKTRGRRCEQSSGLGVQFESTARTYTYTHKLYSISNLRVTFDKQRLTGKQKEELKYTF